MSDWTPEAIEAAHRAMFREPYDGTTAALIGAGLDAAAAAQGIKDEEITRMREDLASAKQAAAAYEAWKFPEDIQALTVENERLLEENARLRKALEPFAARLDELEKMKASKYACATSVEIEHLRAARAAIREGGKDE